MVKYGEAVQGGRGSACCIMLRRVPVWLVKAVEVCWGQMWSGGFRSGEAVQGGRGETRSDMLRSGGVWYGGHGAFRLGIVGFGWSRRSRHGWAR